MKSFILVGIRPMLFVKSFIYAKTIEIDRFKHTYFFTFCNYNGTCI